MLNRLIAAAAVSFAFASPVLAQDVQYELINNTDLTLVQFFSSPADVGDWEEDILGAGVLGAGESGIVTIADGRTQCVYDVQFVFEDGQVLEDTVDICELASYTLSN